MYKAFMIVLCNKHVGIFVNNTFLIDTCITSVAARVIIS